MKKKFGMVIGNPPYQEEKEDNGRQPPVYNIIMDAAHKVAEKTVLITPARFLFDAGATPKDFNQRMLNDPHFKVLDYAPDAGTYFKGVDIEGGVAVTMYDNTKNFGAIGTFTPWQELNAIHQKVVVDNPNFRPLNGIMHTQISYKFSEKFFCERPELLDKFQKNYLGTNVFERLPEIFFDAQPDDSNEYIQVFGLLNNQRTYKWFRRDYINAPALLDKFKIFVPKANGASGKLNDKEPARIISMPVIGDAGVGCTQTFITVGAFDTRAEADACLAYIKSKFARAMLGILKATQDNPPATWAKVPLQDFTPSGAIDWHGDIDAQLYEAYGLDDSERAFIETHVKEMP